MKSWFSLIFQFGEGIVSNPVYFEHQKFKESFILHMCIDKNKAEFLIKIEFKNTTIEKYAKSSEEKRTTFDKKLQTTIDNKKQHITGDTEVWNIPYTIPE